MIGDFNDFFEILFKQGLLFTSLLILAVIIFLLMTSISVPKIKNYFEGFTGNRVTKWLLSLSIVFLFLIILLLILYQSNNKLKETISIDNADETSSNISNQKKENGTAIEIKSNYPAGFQLIDYEIIIEKVTGSEWIDPIKIEIAFDENDEKKLNIYYEILYDKRFDELGNYTTYSNATFSDGEGNSYICKSQTLNETTLYNVWKFPYCVYYDYFPSGVNSFVSNHFYKLQDGTILQYNITIQFYVEPT